MWYNSGAARVGVDLVNMLMIRRFAVGLLLRFVTFALAQGATPIDFSLFHWRWSALYF